jgi:glycosyltransferase involved in cell wall biosynthesis
MPHAICAFMSQAFTHTGIRKSRLLVLASTFPRHAGDTEPSFVYELSRRLCEDFDVTVLAPHTSGALCEENISGIRVLRFRYFIEAYQTLAYDGGILSKLKQDKRRYLLVPCFMIGELIHLVRLLRREHFDAIHAHWVLPQGFAAYIACLLTGRRPALITTAHGGDLFGLRGTIARLLQRMTLRASRQITVVSNALRQHVIKLGVPAGKIHVMPMGVDLKQLFIPPDDQNSRRSEILFAGRLAEKKGVRHLLTAMPFVLEKYPDVILLIIGSGTEQAELAKLSRETGIDGNVKFLGALPNSDLPDYYRRAKIAVIPSVVADSGDQEGFGLVVVEALGCECAVLASDLPAILDIITDGQTGILVSPADPRAVADKLCMLLGDEELRKRLGSAGRAFVLARFDWESCALGYKSLIEEAIAEN